MDKTIACVIVNYNDWKRTLSLTDAIKGYNSIAHIIVVDNCSTDDSRARLQEYHNDKFVYIESDKNGGYGYGNNVGIRAAEKLGADYVLIANPDVVFSDACVEKMLDTMMNTPDCAVVGARETYLGVNGWRYTSDLHDILSTSLIFNKLLKKRYYPASYFEGKDQVPVDVIPGCFLLIDLEIMLQNGMYDEEFFLYEEEKVLYCKMQKAGYGSYVSLTIPFEHRHVDSADTVSKTLTGKKRLLKSKLLFLKKYRNLSWAMLGFAKIFFALTMVEMALYASVLVLKERLHDK